jgi:hypothetical protein
MNENENHNEQSPASIYNHNQNLGEMDEDLRMALELSKTIR